MSKFCFTFLKNLYDFPTNILVGKALTFFLTALTKIFSWETRRNSSSLILRISFKNIIVGNWKVMLPTTFLRLYFLWFSCHFPMRFPTDEYFWREIPSNCLRNIYFVGNWKHFGKCFFLQNFGNFGRKFGRKILCFLVNK